MATERLVVTGNCQARFVANLLASTPAVTERYHVVYHRNFRRGDQGVLHDKTVRLCGLWLEQVAHKGAEVPQKALLPKWSKVIHFPIVWFNSLWPAYTKDPRNPDVAGTPPWPYGDRVILDALKTGASPEAAAQRWLDTDIARTLDLDRFHEINASKALALDARADIKLGSYVLDNFRRERLFVTHNHPSFRMLEVLRDGIFEAMDLPPSDTDVRPVSGGMYNSHVPIHPSVAQHFGLEWWTPELPGRLSTLEFSPREYWRKYAAFEPPPVVSGLDLDTE